jgi:hypothetical protein
MKEVICTKVAPPAPPKKKKKQNNSVNAMEFELETLFFINTINNKGK